MPTPFGPPSRVHKCTCLLTNGRYILDLGNWGKPPLPLLWKLGSFPCLSGKSTMGEKASFSLSREVWKAARNLPCFSKVGKAGIGGRKALDTSTPKAGDWREAFPSLGLSPCPPLNVIADDCLPPCDRDAERGSQGESQSWLTSEAKRGLWITLSHHWCTGFLTVA